MSFKLECDCGGQLVEKDRYFVCQNCGTIYAIGRDDEGNPFRYQPVEKKDIECGKVGVRAAKIAVTNLTVREIKLPEHIDAKVHNTTTHIDKNDNIKLIFNYLEEQEWDRAQSQLNQLLREDSNCAEANWFVMMLDKKARNNKEMIERMMYFTAAEAKRLDKLLSNSTPQFAKTVIDDLFNYAYINDDMCYGIFKTILPYAHNEVIYSSGEYKEKAQKVLDISIKKGYGKTFEYILGCVLQSDEIDKYIKYLGSFSSNPEVRARNESVKYLQKILDVDPGNLKARRVLVGEHLRADSPKEHTIKAVEELLKYSEDTDAEVEKIIKHIAEQQITTSLQSVIMWELLGYHSKGPAALVEYLSSYSKLLLESSLWAEARKYLFLILSINSRNAEAYWNLCLADFEVTDERQLDNEEVLSKLGNIIDDKYYNKALAISLTDDKQRAKYLKDIPKKQKEAKLTAEERRKRKIIKHSIQVGIGAIILAIILAIVFSVRACNNRKELAYHQKYSEANIVLSITEKTQSTDSSYYDGLVTNFKITFTNNSSLDVSSLDGQMVIYNINDLVLYDGTVTLRGDLTAGETHNFNLKLDYRTDDKILELYNADLSDLKVTFKLSSVLYGGWDVKDYPDSKVQILVMYGGQTNNGGNNTPSKEEILQQRYDNAESLFSSGKYLEAKEEYDALGNYKDAQIKSQQCYQYYQEEQYNKGVSKMASNDYVAAYTIFSEISNYKDSASKLTQIKTVVKTSAVQNINNGSYTTASSNLEAVGYTKDEVETIFNEIALEKAKAGCYTQAKNMLESIGLTGTYDYYNNYNFSELLEACDLILEDGFFKNLVSLGVDEVIVSSEVPKIDARAFHDSENLKKVTIQNGITSIGNEAFLNCTALTDIVLPNSITTLGEYAFSGCAKLQNITLSNEILSLSNYLFRSCKNLSNVTLPSKLTTIGSYAFSGCGSLTTITIPEKVTIINSQAFNACYSLVEVINKSKISMTAGATGNGRVAYYAKQVLKNAPSISNFKKSGEYTLYDYNEKLYLLCYSGSSTQITLPGKVDGKTYEINSYAFNNRTDLTKITISNAVTNIGANAFYGCNATIAWESGMQLTTIGTEAFAGYQGSELNIPEGVQTLEMDAFDATKISKIYLPSTLNHIKREPFGYYTITYIVYNGTKAQWNAITKDNYWSYGLGDSLYNRYIIECTDEIINS